MTQHLLLPRCNWYNCLHTCRHHKIFLHNHHPAVSLVPAGIQCTKALCKEVWICIGVLPLRLETESHFSSMYLSSCGLAAVFVWKSCACVQTYHGLSLCIPSTIVSNVLPLMNICCVLCLFYFAFGTIFKSSAVLNITILSRWLKISVMYSRTVILYIIWSNII